MGTYKMMGSTYLITFACYGACLPGQAGAVNRNHNLFGAPLPEADPAQEAKARKCLQQAPYLLDAKRREVVLGAVQGVCLHRGWKLLAAHARTNHVHAVVDADQSPERVMNVFTYASRALNQATWDGPGCCRWARHGSTRYLWTRESVSAAIHYVVCEQGEPMAVFEAAP